jgi:hypothetical protein
MHFIAKLIWITSTKRKEQYIQKTPELLFPPVAWHLSPSSSTLSVSCIFHSYIFLELAALVLVFSLFFPLLLVLSSPNCLDHSVDAVPVADIDVI